VNGQQPPGPGRHRFIRRNIDGGEITCRGEMLLQLCDFRFRPAAAEHGVAEPDELFRQGAPATAGHAGNQDGFHVSGGTGV